MKFEAPQSWNDALYAEAAIFKIKQWMDRQGYDLDDVDRLTTVEELLEFIMHNTPP